MPRYVVHVYLTIDTRTNELADTIADEITADIEKNFPRVEVAQDDAELEEND